MTADPVAKLKRYTELSKVFTPGAPVASRDRFAGRVAQVLKVLAGIAQPGMQVVLYGERGVGKTSLANVLSEFLLPIQGTTRVVRINCTTSDKFTTIWTKIYRELGIERPESWSYSTPDPDEIRRDLQRLEEPAVVILDEYDRIEDDQGLSLMADAIKALSDHGVPTKLVVVGVGDSIDNLVGEHESVQRALIEVQMPRMSQGELTGIIDADLKAVEMTIEDRARQIVGRLARIFHPTGVDHGAAGRDRGVG